MKKDLISIIVPIYNAEKYLKRCIESIISQTYLNLEIILVDDGSKDNSSKICDDYANKDNRIKVIHKENEGVSKARNDGLKLATGKYILFVDSDDWLEKEMCEKMINKIISNDSDLVVCEYNNFYENENRTENVNLKDLKNVSFAEIISDDSNKYGGFPWNKLIKRSVIKNNFREDIFYYENLLFFLENSNNIKRYSVVHEKLYNYNINDGSALHSKKYSLKKLTALEALSIAIPIIPEKNKDGYKAIFIRTYFNNLFSIKKEKYDLKNIEKYLPKVKEYYKDIINSKSVDTKMKIRIFVLYRFNFIYSFYKRLKG